MVNGLCPAVRPGVIETCLDGILCSHDTVLTIPDGSCCGLEERRLKPLIFPINPLVVRSARGFTTW
jgi:hypothetical protein